MATETPTKRITPEELLEMTDGDHYELVDGKIVERPMSAGSARIGSRFNNKLSTFGDETRAACAFRCASWPRLLAISKSNCHKHRNV